MKIKAIKKQCYKKLLLLMAGCVLLAPVAFADIAVIVNPVNKGVSMTRSEIQEIFMGIRQSLPNGSAVVPFDQGADQPMRQTFYELVAGKSPVQMKSYWSRIIFTGKGNPPQALANGGAVKSRVAGQKNAIGYVDAASAKADSSVSVVFVIPTQ